MFNINRASIDTIAKSVDSKKDLGETNKVVFDTFKLTLLNLEEVVKKYYVYDMAHWINNIDRWIKNLTSINKTQYTRGSIVILDLGSQNFRYEPSYAHPCVVIFDRQYTILVAPSSSKKFGKGFPEIIDAGQKDGFSSNTGVQIESFRWVNKNRVISVVGKVNNDLLNEMDRRMLFLIPLLSTS